MLENTELMRAVQLYESFNHLGSSDVDGALLMFTSFVFTISAPASVRLPEQTRCYIIRVSPFVNSQFTVLHTANSYYLERKCEIAHDMCIESIDRHIG